MSKGCDPDGKPCKENRAEASTDNACLSFTVMFTGKSWTYTTNDAYTRDVEHDHMRHGSSEMIRWNQTAVWMELPESNSYQPMIAQTLLLEANAGKLE